MYSSFKSLFTLFTVLSLSTSAKAQNFHELFEKNDAWHTASEVKIGQRDMSIVAKGDDIFVNLKKLNLATQKAYSDCTLKMDFLLPKSPRFGNSGVFFLSRYEIHLGNTFQKRLGMQTSGAVLFKKAPMVNAAKRIGEWQTLEVTFRAPRFGSDGRKTSQAMFVKVVLNDKLIHENVFVSRPTKYAPAANEVDKAPIQLQANRCSIAIRNVEIKSIDLSHIKTPKLSVQESIPLDDKGHPQVDLVAEGKKVFENKGCVTCHAIDLNANVVKTGPTLFGLLQKVPKKIKVIDKAEDHLVEIVADEDYIRQSIRQPYAILALNKKDGNKPFLPIMIPFTPEILSDGEIDCLMAYIKTLNPKAQQGPLIHWASKPSKQYDISKDIGAVIVTKRPRIQRVDIGAKHSARAFHVGLPGGINYSFDQRILGVVDIWNGPFVRVTNEMNGRAGEASQTGSGAFVWETSVPYFQPLYEDGSKVDFSFREPAHVDEKTGLKFVSETGNFVSQVQSVKANFLGLTTPKNDIPVFEYDVEENVISLKFTPSLKNNLHAQFTMKLKKAQTFTFPTDDFKDIKVNVGIVSDGLWKVPVGNYNNISFTATRKVKFKKSFTAGMNQLPKDQPQQKQMLSWYPVDGKTKPNYSVLSGYSMSTAELPKDHFGNKVKLFEPLGIDFFGNDTAFISTRTAGIWKIHKGEWHLFAEGTYESIGIVAESENTVVIGEKTGLMRLRDNDGDHWADHRQNLSDHFRFNGNYHEYLHGPIKVGDRYLYNLNLSHRLPGHYKAGGQHMGTIGGLRGWLCQVNSKGEFSTFASGFRSPAGLSTSPDGEIVYTDNQGEYVGTSKMFIVKKGKFYGNPTGLVDLPGMNDKSKEVQFDAVKNKRELPLVLMPHSKTLNSPGNPGWDTTKGKFGPYAGKIFIGDQTQSRIFVVDRQKVGSIEQGALIPFAQGLSSGVMRLKFNPADNSLWIGQTGRGWRSRGGANGAFQKMTWNGVMPNAIKSVKATPTGFDIIFTQAQPAGFGDISLRSWYYIDSANYGSPEKDRRDEKVSITWSADKLRCSLTVDDFKVESKEGTTNTSRVYHIDLEKTKFAEIGKFLANAYYTLHAIPKK